jgi:hypothetical protein
LAVANSAKASTKTADSKTPTPIKKRELKMAECEGGLVFMDGIEDEFLNLVLFTNVRQQNSMASATTGRQFEILVDPFSGVTDPGYNQSLLTSHPPSSRARGITAWAADAEWAWVLVMECALA